MRRRRIIKLLKCDNKTCYLLSRTSYLFKRTAYLLSRTSYFFKRITYLFSRTCYLFKRITYLFKRWSYPHMKKEPKKPEFGSFLPKFRLFGLLEPFKHCEVCLLFYFAVNRAFELRGVFKCFIFHFMNTAWQLRFKVFDYDLSVMLSAAHWSC